MERGGAEEECTVGCICWRGDWLRAGLEGVSGASEDGGGGRTNEECLSCGFGGEVERVTGVHDYSVRGNTCTSYME